MRKLLSFLLSLFLIIGLASCGDKTPTATITETPTEVTPTNPNNSTGDNNNDSTGENNNGSTSNNGGTENNGGNNDNTGNTNINVSLDIQDGTILHAWNWSMKNIKDNMAAIKDAGYTAVQTSPMQTQKDLYKSSGWKSEWWKLYQPYGFEIATKDHSLGTKQDLIDMCAEAEKYGIKVIVDVVANHLAGDSTTKFSPKVSTYAKDIYDNNLMHNYGYADDSSVQKVVQGTIGSFPDLKTESEVVQQAVLKLLKDYIDCGVDGFRFDAAKHIETPDDGDFASQFWPTVINGSTEYAKSKGLDTPYYYGEILYTCGAGRSISSYTKYMSVTDNQTGNNVRNAVVGNNDAAAGNYVYATGLPAEKVVLWAESHDTYANEEKESTNVSDANINKAYAIVASRTGATSLFFARPKDSQKLGEVGKDNWKAKEVVEVNKFHNAFVGTSEYITGSNGYVWNTRYDDDRCGIVIVCLKGSTDVNQLKVEKLKDGSYIEQITGNTFTVKDGKISGKIGSTGIGVIYNADEVSKPVISVKDNGTKEYISDFVIEIKAYNSNSAYYQINDGEKQNFNGSTKIDLSNQKLGDVTVKVVVSDGKNTTTKTLTYKKVDQLSASNVLYLKPNSNWTQGNAWFAVYYFGSSGNGWAKMTDTDKDGIYEVVITADYEQVIFCRMNPASSATDWSNRWDQTVDLTPSGNLFTVNNGEWNEANGTWSSK